MIGMFKTSKSLVKVYAKVSDKMELVLNKEQVSATEGGVMDRCSPQWEIEYTDCI